MLGRPLTKLLITGKKSEIIDFLIYIPHAENDARWITQIRETARVDTSGISDTAFLDYMVHASDTGTREVAYECIEAFADSDYTIGILDVCIPRAYCDMNRPRDKAILGTLDSDFWLPLYDRAQQEIEDSISRSRFCFQLHSMNNFDPLYDWKIESGSREGDIYEYLDIVYSGRRRECTLLTGTRDGQTYSSDRRFDSILRQIFSREGILLEENTAFQLSGDYPCDAIMKKIPSSFLEIRKGSLATRETLDMIRTHQIVFDPKKISLFAHFIRESMHSYLL